jgi:uncharacterized protein YcbX
MTITVRALSITPVKGTRIRRVDSVTLDADGARGDRAFYIVDGSGRLVNGKRFGMLQTVLADYDEAGEQLSLRLPDGDEVSGPVILGPEISTSFFSQPRSARVLQGPWSAALSDVAGQPMRIVHGGIAADRGREGAISLVSRGSLERLAEAAIEGDSPATVDARRFRMLIEIDGVGAHEEDRWVGRELTVGAARVRMRGHVGRCATTTRSPDTGTVDLPTLKILADYRLDEPTSEPLAFGVYGEVTEGGVVRVGDPVSVAGASVGRVSTT